MIFVIEVASCSLQPNEMDVDLNQKCELVATRFLVLCQSLTLLPLVGSLIRGLGILGPTLLDEGLLSPLIYQLKATRSNLPSP